MATAADESTGSGAPFAKFAKPGDTLIGAFGSRPKKTTRQRTDFKTGELLWKDAAKTRPSLEEVMWFVAMPGTTAVVGDLQNDQTSPINEGDIIRYAVFGFKWGQIIDQRKKLPEYSGFRAGMVCSGDVYEIRMTGWSAETENAQAAINAGLTVVEGRIVMRSADEHERWVMAQVKRNANSNAAKDFDVVVRRPTAAEKRWEQEADALLASEPWKGQPAIAGGGGTSDDEPF